FGVLEVQTACRQERALLEVDDRILSHGLRERALAQPEDEHVPVSGTEHGERRVQLDRAFARPVYRDADRVKDVREVRQELRQIDGPIRVARRPTLRRTLERLQQVGEKALISPL